MKSPDAPLADDSFGLHEEIAQNLGQYEQEGNLPAAPTPVRDDTTRRDEADLWRPRNGDNARNGPLTMAQVITYLEAQVKKWRKEAKADDFKEMKRCAAYSLLAQQANHIVELLKRVKPVASVSSDNAATAKDIVHTLLSAISDGTQVISTADAVRVLVSAFPDLFDGAASLRAAGKRLRGLLQGLGISTVNLRINGQVVKGYRVADLREAAM